MLPTILIIGKNGQVGYELRRACAPLGNVTAVDYPDLDLARPDAIRGCVRDTRPSIVINAAAYTAVDKAETDVDRCEAINAVAPGILAEEAHRAGALFVHYSTDYVFDGARTSPYTEDDPPNPLGAYGRTKQAGDRAVAQAGGAHLIFRLCWVYGARGQNFMLTMQRLAREREQLRVVHDQRGCPTWARLIAEATAEAVARVAHDPDPARFSGTYHLAAAGVASWHEFARAIIDLMPPDTRKCREVVPIATHEYPTPARRPAYSVLDCTKLERTFGLRLPHWQDALRLVCEA